MLFRSGRGLCTCGRRGSRARPRATLVSAAGRGGGSRKSEGTKEKAGRSPDFTRRRNRTLPHEEEGPNREGRCGADQPGPRPEKRLLTTGEHSVPASSSPPRLPLQRGRHRHQGSAGAEKVPLGRRGTRSSQAWSGAGSTSGGSPAPGSPQASSGQALGSDPGQAGDRRPESAPQAPPTGHRLSRAAPSG